MNTHNIYNGGNNVRAGQSGAIYLKYEMCYYGMFENKSEFTVLYYEQIAERR